MVEPFSPDGPRELLTDLCQLISQRVPAEKAIASGFRSRGQAAEKASQDGRRELSARLEAEKTAARNEFTSSREEIVAKCDAEQAVVQSEYDEAREAVTARFDADKEMAEQIHQTANWEAAVIAESAKGGSGVQLSDMLFQLDARWKELQTIHQQAVALLDRWGQWHEFTEPQPSNSLIERHPARRFSHALDLARAQYLSLSRQIAPRFFQGIWPLGIFLLIWTFTVFPAGAIFGWNNWYWAAASGGGSLLIFAVVGGWFYFSAQRHCGKSYTALRRTLLEAGLDRPAVLEAAKLDCQRLFASIDARYSEEVKRSNDRFATAMIEISALRENQIQQIETKYPARLAEIATYREQALKQADSRYSTRLAEMEERFTSQSKRLVEEYTRTNEESLARFNREWAEMAGRWQNGIEQFRESVREIGSKCDGLFPDWHTSDWDRWAPPHEIPQAISFGHSDVKLEKIPGGIPKEERLRPAQTDYVLPILLPLPQHSLLMLKAADEGRASAIDAIQAVMLRLLTSIPPGKVRFTIFDPVGLGENFSAFMHLADYDEQLVASRIWTDAEHIERRLADLTQHMENVIQVYLRNEFQSIQQYNAFAGEMAEPYRVLVIANFPANFSEAAAQRLKSIVASGARCGVFVLMSVDTKLPALRQFQPTDLETDALVLNWANGEFIWQHPQYGPLPVVLDRPPTAERFTEIVRTVGHDVKDAGRVEVPFQCIIPAEKDWWTGDSRGGIDVPLGRAGAMKLQHLELGKGTSQHVLISGKTGSGKSTLLHVLITNVALSYSPDEVEMYLIDFKKGVEFKAYARFALPHTRVVAIESEREFGLSVLQRLDAELRTRGDLFRKRGVQDLKGFRNAEPDAKLPRILLIIDEFQELFVEDDRIGQESALLLDRLVRQGRAFGIHVFLGSQTLGGAYSLARSTIGQMAVRIALQCSESDAHLVLSEDNTAARLLTRPGEAIYNDANGLYEGNHPFQVVWLPDDQRDEYLQRVKQMAGDRQYGGIPAIIFEGNIPADAAENPFLAASLAEAAWPVKCDSPQAWLGSAVAIKEPTAAVFMRQPGSNLLMVGHREETSLGVLATSMVSLASQLTPGPASGDPVGARFYVLDGTRPEAPEAGLWNRITAAIPHCTTIGSPREAAQIVAELARELAQRREEGRETLAPIYLIIYNLGRFRDLRKDDDFGFGGSDEASASPGKQFATLLREGPAWGIHSLVWCDSYSTASRLLDRQSLRDFELRVLFQMNATDSSSLMDGPDASRLGVNRAIFYDEGHGQTEKFRPYGLPSADWLAEVSRQLHARPRDAGSESAD